MKNYDELKQFKKSEWIKFYRNYCQNLEESSLIQMYKGIDILIEAFDKFNSDKYGSKKRLKDLHEYQNEPLTELLKRMNKKGVI